MSPRRYRPNFEARPILEGLPRTNINTPGFLSSAGAVLGGMGLFMLSGRPPSGEWSPSMETAFRAAGWTSLGLGAALLLGAAASLRRDRRRALAAASGAPDAWTLDHSWTPGTARDHAVAAACEAFFWIVMSFGVGAGGLIVARLGGPNAGALMRISALFLAAVASAGVYLSFGPLRRGLLFGESRLRWDGGGPLRAGSEWTGSIEVVDGVAAPYAHLQFIKEQRIAHSENVEYRRHKHERLAVACRLERGADGRKILRLTANVPAGAPSTELSRDPARYWELFVADDASGWATAFLVPVYR